MCKTSAEVIDVQDRWLEAARETRKSDTIDYPPSCSSSSGESELEEGEGEKSDDGQRSSGPPSLSSLAL